MIDDIVIILREVVKTKEKPYREEMFVAAAQSDPHEQPTKPAKELAAKGTVWQLGGHCFAATEVAATGTYKKGRWGLTLTLTQP